jgi:hypothetical protein
MKFLLMAALFFSPPLVSIAGEHDNEIIINEIGNGGTKRGMYTGKEYVELLVVKPEGVKLAGWYLTDLASPSAKRLDNEGALRFSDRDGSVFKQTIPSGTYIVVCLGHAGDTVGTEPMGEDVSLTDGNNRVVVFADSLSKHIDIAQGAFQINGKDNLVLLSAWKKNAAVNMLVWEGGCSWTGCTPLEVPKDMIDNGAILYFAPGGKNRESFYEVTNIVRWASSTYPGDATPGRKNPGVDDRQLRTK